jgi:predicted metalloprotease with PDZ domain
MWRRHGVDEHGRPRGSTDQDVLDAFARAGGEETATFVEHLTTVPGVPDLTGDLAVLGLTEDTDPKDDVPRLGVLVENRGERIVLRTVLRDGPAWHAGISGDDVLLAIDGETLSPAELPTVLRRHGAATTVQLTVRRGPRILERAVRLEAAAPRPRLRTVTATDAATRARFSRWSGQTLPD